MYTELLWRILLWLNCAVISGFMWCIHLYINGLFAYLVSMLLSVAIGICGHNRPSAHASIHPSSNPSVLIGLTINKDSVRKLCAKTNMAVTTLATQMAILHNILLVPGSNILFQGRFPDVSAPPSGMCMYSISQKICTRFCCALLWCGYVIIYNEFTWCIYPYSPGLLCWPLGNR